MRTLFVKMALAAVAVSWLLYQPAQAWTVDIKPDNNPLGLGRPLIEVESDGEEWTNIRSATRQLQLRVNVDVGTGWRVMTVWMKLPNADFCESGATPEGCDLIFGGKTKHFSDTVTHDFSTDHIGGIEAQAIVDKCNADNYQGNRDRDFEGFNVSVGIKAYVLRRSEANDFSEPNQGRTTYAYTTVPVTIRCLAPPQKIEALKPVSVDLRVKQKGETCPKDTEVTASIDYEHEATARFQVIHNGNASNVIEADTRQVTLAGKTWHRIDYVKKYKLDPGKHRFKIKVIGGGHSKKETVTVDCPPFQATSMWLTLKTENQSTCPKDVDASVRINGNGPGAVLTKIKNHAGMVMAIESIKVEREGDQYVGRLTKTFNMTAIDTMLIAEDANDSSHNSGWQPLKIECLEALSGELTLQSLGDTACKGEALVAIHTNGAGDLPYELECGPGKSWQRKVAAMANKIGVDKVDFDVSNNEQVTCVLRTRIAGVLKSLDGASKTFQCHKPIDTGTSDLTPELPPGDPPVVGPTLTGDFSFVDTGGTRCPRQGKALINFETSKPDNVHWSLDCTNGHFSGVAQTAPSPKGGYIAPALASFAVNQTTHAKCALKTVAPGKPKVHSLKGHNFQCVGRTDVGGPEGLTPETPSDPQTPGTAVIDPPKPDAPEPDRPSTAVVDPLRPTISCAGGAVKNGACICERTMKAVKAGKNAWRCVADAEPDKPTVSQPKISCAGGRVENGACTCARTHKPVKAGKNAWRCVKTVVIDPPRNKDSANKANKFEVKTAPKKTAQPRLGNADKAKDGKAKGKAAKKGNGSSARR